MSFIKLPFESADGAVNNIMDVPPDTEHIALDVALDITPDIAFDILNRPFPLDKLEINKFESFFECDLFFSHMRSLR